MIDVIFPCLDEAGALPWIMQRLPIGMRALVVDNGSSDGSAEIAAGLGATVISCKQRGYGAACHAGLLESQAPFVAFCDCDGSIDPAVLVEFARRLGASGDKLLDNKIPVDLVLGRRRPAGRGAWPPHARAANSFLAWWLNRRVGTSLHDIGPVRMARRDALLALDLADRRSGYPLETVVRAARAGWQIAEIEVDYRPRVGRSKVTGTVRGTLHAISDMSAQLARHA